MLLTERSAVIEAPIAIETNPAKGAPLDPTWDHAGFTKWTPDLVHFRLLLAGEVIASLPPALRRRYVSMMGDDALSDLDRPRRSAATPAELSLADWTWERITERPATQRVVLTGKAFGISPDKIAGSLGRMGTTVKALKRLAVTKCYLTETRRFAGAWQSGKVALCGYTGRPVCVPLCQCTKRERLLGLPAILDRATIERYCAETEEKTQN